MAASENLELPIRQFYNFLPVPLFLLGTFCANVPTPKNPSLQEAFDRLGHSRAGLVLFQDFVDHLAEARVRF